MIKSVYDVINHYAEQFRINPGVAYDTIEVNPDEAKKTPCLRHVEFLLDSMSYAHCNLAQTSEPWEDMEINDRIEADARSAVDAVLVYWHQMGWSNEGVVIEAVRHNTARYIYACLLAKMRMALYVNNEFIARARNVLGLTAIGSNTLIMETIKQLPLRDLDAITDNDISTAYGIVVVSVPEE